MRQLCALLLVSVVIAGCAARSNAVQAGAVLARTDELVRQGCYDCLLEARAVNEGLSPALRRSVLLPLLEVELLLAMREKELAIDSAATLARARAIAAELGPAANAEQYVSIVDAVTPDRAGTPLSHRPLSPLTAGREGLQATMSAIDASPLSMLFRRYLAASIQCGRPPLDPQQSPPAPAGP